MDKAAELILEVTELCEGASSCPGGTAPIGDGPVGAENRVVPGQAAFRYSLMSPPQRAVLTTWR